MRLVLLAAVLSSACAQGGGGLPRNDAGDRLDASGRDAGPPSDAGPPDAGRDAGVRDAGSDAGPCDETPCKLTAPQCGCLAGEGCYLGADGMRMCAEAGRTAPGVRCASPTACEPGHACVGTAGTTWCHRFCASDADCSGPGSVCILTLGDGMGGTVPDVTLCTMSCDPVDNTACPTLTACTIFRESDGAMRFLTHCRGAGMAGQGAACADDIDCQAGYGCVGPAGGATVCRHWCRVATGAGCPAGTACQSLATPAIIGGVEYGVCG